MDSAELAKLVGYGASQSFDSLLVVRHGRIVTEAYYAPYTADVPHNLFSSTKAVTGTLLGMVHKDGLLDRLDHPVLDFFTDLEFANVDDRKKAISVQNLLDMTSGLDEAATRSKPKLLCLVRWRFTHSILRRESEPLIEDFPS